MIIKIIIIGIIGAILATVLRPYKGEYSSMISIACGIIIITMLMDDIASVVEAVKTAINGLGIETSYITILFKIIGIAYLTQFGASICADAGETAIAMKIELAGRLAIILMSAPIMFAILNLITGILP